MTLCEPHSSEFSEIEQKTRLHVCQNWIRCHQWWCSHKVQIWTSKPRNKMHSQDTDDFFTLFISSLFFQQRYEQLGYVFSQQGITVMVAFIGILQALIYWSREHSESKSIAANLIAEKNVVAGSGLFTSTLLTKVVIRSVSCYIRTNLDWFYHWPKLLQFRGFQEDI